MKSLIIHLFILLPSILFSQSYIKKIELGEFDLKSSEVFSIGNNDYLLIFQHGNYLLRSFSNDGGLNWSTPDTIIQTLSSTRKLWDVTQTADGQYLFLVLPTSAYQLNLYKSINNGLTFIFISSVITPTSSVTMYDLSINQIQNHQLMISYRSTTQGYFSISNDYGFFWSSFNSLSLPTSATKFSINVASNGNYLAFCQTIFDLKYSISTDQGQSWNIFQNLVATPYQEYDPVSFKTQNGFIRVYYNRNDTVQGLSSTRSNIYFVESSDNSVNWSQARKVTKYLGKDSLITIFKDSDGLKVLFLTDRLQNLDNLFLSFMPAEENADILPPPIFHSLNIQLSHNQRLVNFKVQLIDIDPITSVHISISDHLIQLYDDGQHQDEAPNDLIFGNSYELELLDFKNLLKVNHLKFFYSQSGEFIEYLDEKEFENIQIKVLKNSTEFVINQKINPTFINQFDEGNVAFNIGFTLTGYNNDFLWANGSTTVWRLKDYQSGKYGSNPTDPKNRIYKVKKSDPHFGQSWQEWRDAVSLGAYFYDGDGDGIYNPIDKNGNGRWDPNEDMPDILGDETIWMIYNDGVSQNERRFTDVYPLGIEIRQTIFASKRPGLNQTIFSRYSILNTGSVAQALDSVVFSIFADADIGDFPDDLTGTDTLLNSSYIYNDGSDNVYGINPPTLFHTFVQMPWTFTGQQTDTAYNHLGKMLGRKSFVGYRHSNLIASFKNIQTPIGEPYPATRFEVRYHAIGRITNGRLINPCTFSWGQVLGIDCNLVSPVFYFSGDPVTRYGWINTISADMRTLLSVGPFRLEANKPVDIIVAHTAGRGVNSLNSITVARQLVQEVLNEYRSNFATITSVDENGIVEIPKEFKLFQNYPNPFNSKTKIEFYVPISGEVKLILYDALGREIAKLINEKREAGNYVYELEAAKFKLSSGVYFYKLKNEGNIQIKKMLYLK